MFNIGIIGCGKIAQVRHIPEYAAHPAARLTGYYDLNQERAQALAAQWGGRAYPTWEALLADPAIDAVSICAANTAHAELTIAALRAGKHVLCEKPMATTLADCEAMVAAARESGKFLMIGQNQRLTKAHQKARQLVADGVLGDILTFRTTFGHGGRPGAWIGQRTPGSSARARPLWGRQRRLGIHKTDLIQYLLGQTVVEAAAKVTTLDKRGPMQLIGVDDNAICIYRMSGGAIGTMTASWTYYGAEDNSTVLYGTKGILRIYDSRPTPQAHHRRRGEGALRAGGHPDQRQPDRLRRHRLLHGLPDRQHAPRHLRRVGAHRHAGRVCLSGVLPDRQGGVRRPGLTKGVFTI